MGSTDRPDDSEHGPDSSMRTFVVADTHFGHRNICQYSGRPWSDWVEMDIELIRRWNEAVGPDDIVYHLGDVAMGPEPESYLGYLNGRLHLVVGNHDHRIKKHPRWETVSNRAVLDVGGVMLHMRHHPWQPTTDDGLFVHGHCHGTIGRTHQMGENVFNMMWALTAGRMCQNGPLDQ